MMLTATHAHAPFRTPGVHARGAPPGDRDGVEEALRVEEDRDAPSLEALMSRYVAGDAEAFHTVHAQTRPRLLAFLTMLTGDRSRADDLCQTTYLKLHRTRHRYRTGAPLLPYLMTIARNAFLDEARAGSRARVRVTDSGVLPDVADPSARHPSAANELRRALRGAVAELPPLQREAFVLTKQRGFSPRDVARHVGATETAVKLRVHRAYLTLRKALEQYHDEA